MKKKSSRNSEEMKGVDLERGVGGIFKGLAGLVEKLGELAEMGEEISKSGEFPIRGSGKGLRGVYGFSVKVGAGDRGISVEPFGNIRKDAKSGRAVAHEIREPMVDIFEEENYTLVVAEMPGIGPEDVRIALEGEIMTISAEKGDKKFRKEIHLPEEYPEEKVTVSCNNGIAEIKCAK